MYFKMFRICDPTEHNDAHVDFVVTHGYAKYEARVYLDGDNNLRYGEVYHPELGVRSDWREKDVEALGLDWVNMAYSARDLIEARARQARALEALASASA